MPVIARLPILSINVRHGCTKGSHEAAGDRVSTALSRPAETRLRLA